MDKKTEESLKNYNKIASNYDETFDGKYTLEFKLQLSNVVRLENGYRVLDVACGNGTLLKLLSDKKQIQAYGVDISENMLNEAKKKFPEMVFAYANSSELPFESDFFDAITVSAAFHHFTEPEKFLSEAWRILKRGGYLYIADPYFPPVIRQITNLILRTNLTLPLTKMGDVKVYNKSELIGFLKDGNFVNIDGSRFIKKGLLAVGMKSKI
ncbi:MAG TPA: class I SAM-dependent methyltransferase [Clostridia bacterium]|nr:class I SAM-dependent methyltransferase [Clostridia bacterium]